MSEDTSSKILKLEKISMQELPAAFAEWVSGQELGEVGAWLQGLSDAEKKAVTAEVAGFCEDAGFNLAWVIQSQIDNEVLGNKLQHIVTHYLNAVYEAGKAQQSLTLYKTLVKWLSNPMARKHWAYTREIYIRLVNQGVIPNASAEILLDNDRNRWEHVESSLQQAYQNDPKAVSDLVQSVLMAKKAPALALSERTWWPLNRNHSVETVPAQVAESLAPA